MQRFLLPMLGAILVSTCLLLNGEGRHSLETPAVIFAILFIMGVCCVPMLRRARWLANVPWFGLLLLWNALGGVIALCIILATILPVQDPTNFLLPRPLGWCFAAFVWLWFWLWLLPMPLTTLVATVGLWGSRKTLRGRVLLLGSAVAFILWIGLVVIAVVYAGV
jgi:hypothetical protein